MKNVEQDTPLADVPLGAMPYLVHELSPDEHILQSDPQYLSKAYHPHRRSIRLCLWMVYLLRYHGQDISLDEEKDTCS